MKRLLFCLLTVVALAGCSSLRRGVVSERKGSVRTVTRYERIFLKDTVYLEIPRQNAERTTGDSVSHLENDYAVSDARIERDGMLYHDLYTKPRKMPVPVEKEYVRNDSIVYVHDKVEVPVPVEVKLSRWQQLKIHYGGYALTAVFFVILVVVGCTVYKLKK